MAVMSKVENGVMSNGERVHIEKIGRRAVLVGETLGVLAVDWTVRDAKGRLSAIAEVDAKRAAWKAFSINQEIKLNDRMTLRVLKWPGKPLMARMLDPRPKGGIIAEIKRFEYASTRTTALLGVPAFVGKVSCGDGKAASLLVEHLEDLLGATMIPETGDYPEARRFLWERTNSGRAIDVEAAMRAWKKEKTKFATIFAMKDNLDPGALATLAAALDWTMKVARDGSGEIVECWLECPDGSLFDGLAFSPQGDFDEVTEGCTVEDANVVALADPARHGAYKKFALELLGEEIDRRGQPAAPALS